MEYIKNPLDKQISNLQVTNDLLKKEIEENNNEIAILNKKEIKNPLFKNKVIDYMFKNSNKKVSKDDLEIIFDYTYQNGKDPLWIIYLSIQKIESDWYQYAYSSETIIENDKKIKKDIARGIAGIHKLWTKKLIEENIWNNKRDVFSITKNIDAQKRIFLEYLNLEGNINDALISYCLGPNSLKIKRDQTKYHHKVLKVQSDIYLIISNDNLKTKKE